MITVATIDALGRTAAPVIQFQRDAVHYIDGTDVRDLEVLMRRLYLDKKMDADEMRDWGNRLHTMLCGVRDNVAIEGEK